MGLTNAERETVVVFDEESEWASIFTFSPRLMRKAHKFVESEPQSGHVVRVNDDGGTEFEILKSRLSINFKKTVEKKPMTDEEKAALVERLRKAREGK